MVSSAWSHGTSRSATSTVPCTEGSITTLRPVISENVRSTARRSTPWKSRLIGCPVNCLSCPGSVRRRAANGLGGRGGRRRWRGWLELSGRGRRHDRLRPGRGRGRGRRRRQLRHGRRGWLGGRRGHGRRGFRCRRRRRWSLGVFGDGHGLVGDRLGSAAPARCPGRAPARCRAAPRCTARDASGPGPRASRAARRCWSPHARERDCRNRPRSPRARRHGPRGSPRPPGAEGRALPRPRAARGDHSP